MSDRILGSSTWSRAGGSGHPLWRMARTAVGIVLVVVGAIAWVLPIVPGVPLLLLGVAMLGTRHWMVRPFARWIARWQRPRRR